MSGNAERKRMGILCPKCGENKFYNDMVYSTEKGCIFISALDAGVFKSSRISLTQIMNDVLEHFTVGIYSWKCIKCRKQFPHSTLFGVKLCRYYMDVSIAGNLTMYQNRKPEGF